MCFGGAATQPPVQQPALADQGASALKLGGSDITSPTGMGRLMLRLTNSATGAIAPSASSLTGQQGQATSTGGQPVPYQNFEKTFFGSALGLKGNG